LKTTDKRIHICRRVLVGLMFVDSLLLLCQGHSFLQHFTMATLHDLFQSQAEKTPDVTAVIQGNRELKFHELNSLANQFSRYLATKGIRPNDVVTIGLPHSLELVVAMLGILKSGCTYITLDLCWPQARIDFILSDCQARLLVTTSEVANNLAIPLHIPAFYCDSQWSELHLFSHANVNLVVASETVAYIVYTSGSTGKPKGVLGHHDGMINRLQWSWSTFPYQPYDRCCAKTTLGFVDSVAEFFSPLCKGVPLYLFGVEAAKQDLVLFVSLLATARITRMILVPSLLNSLLALFPDLSSQLPYLRHWEISGEAVTAELSRRFLSTYPSNNAALLNFYGSSEVIDATYHQITEKDLQYSSSMPVGRCIPHMKCYVLDDDFRPVSQGEKGHIYLGGKNLALGYLNLPELTRKAFITNRFDDADLYPILYKMGDIGSFSKDGVLFYHGRSDHQVKINGVRVELGEIEAALLRCAGVHFSAAKYWLTSDHHGLLVGYISYKSGQSTIHRSVDAIRKCLSDELPAYMVPAQIVALSEMPLNANGKVDRLALVPPITLLDDENCPVSDLEKEILALVQAQIGPKFLVNATLSFTSMGVNSLTYALVRSEIQSKFGVVLSLREMMQVENIRQLADVVFSHKECVVSDSTSVIAGADVHKSPVKNFSCLELAKSGCLMSGPLHDSETNITYQVFSREHFEHALSLASTVFTVYEPICSHLQTTVEEFKSVYSSYFADAIEERLSVVAVKNGEVIGITIALDRFEKGVVPDINVIQDCFTKEKLDPMFDITDCVYMNEIIPSARADKVMIQLVTAVDPNYMAAEIAETIEKYSLSLAIQREFKLVVTEVSSPLSQSIAKMLGFELHSVCSYETFKDSKGHYPFKGLTGGLQLATLHLPSLSKD
jgi:amino acid adenylation domain-containing protein